MDNLRNLLIIRSIALLGQTGVLAYVLISSRTTHNLWGAALSLLVLAVITMVSLWRTGRPWPVTDREFLAQLLVDVLGWTALMYFTGGASNPFISYYIVPLVISAAVLPWRHTWLVAGSSLLAYSLLLYYYQPFPLFSPHAHGGQGDMGNVHVLGMWFNFLFSAGLITYFVVRMAATLRLQETRTRERREHRLRNDQIMSVASLAAGTAHELGTPLSTMTVLIDELLLDESLGQQAREDCQLLKQQLGHCKNTLAELSRTAELTSTQQQERGAIADFVTRTVARWAVRRPAVIYTLSIDGDRPKSSPRVADTDTRSPKILYDASLAQALENLLNNAADSGSREVAIACRWSGHWAEIAVRDRGRGIPAEKLEELGKPVIQASNSGLGIGLLLSHATVERFGGRIELSNRQGGGTIATLFLPLENEVAGQATGSPS